MNRTISFRTTVAWASLAAWAALSPACAEAEAADNAAEKKPAAAAKVFSPMMRCTRAVGTVSVLRPRTESWIDAVEGRFYPLGSVVRVAGDGGRATTAAAFEFGEKASILVTNAAEFAVREVEFGAQERVVELKSGQICLSLPRSLREGLFKVVTPAFQCENLAGESRFDYRAEADGDEVVVRCVTGTMSLTGENYAMPRIGAANQIRIRTTGSSLFTSLRGESGDCAVKLDQGLFLEKDFETGATNVVARQLDFMLSPQCSVKIFRAQPAADGKYRVVNVMTFNPAGKMLNRFAFTKDRANVNSGELVVSTKVPEDAGKAEKAEDEETETVEAKADEGDKAEEKADEAADGE